jgi:hypothetical protein
MSTTMASQDGSGSGSLRDPRVRPAQPGTPTDGGLTSFAQPVSARGDTLLPIAPIKTGGSTVFSHACASNTVPSLRATTGASTCTVSLKEEGVEGSSQATDRQNFRAPNVRFLLKDH